MNIYTGSIQRRRLIAGLLSWLIPFLISVPFYDKTGSLLIDLTSFKSIVIGVATLSAAILMVWFFRVVSASYTREAV